MSDTPPPYPLVFEPILLEKVWGGRALEKLGKRLEQGRSYGESWEIADLGATSAGGAGGGAARSVIANGPLAGRTLGAAAGLWGRDLLGASRTTADGGFPLLVKFLDARENLSVQVHPNPAYAAAHRGAHLKTETWYVLHAEPGSVIYKGIKPGVDRAALARHIGDGSVVGDLIAVPAVRGECHHLPSGTCHALGAGVVVAEVQTPSDTTFRVFDWGRTGRELHVEQALECIEFGPAPAATSLPARESRGRLAATDSYTIDELRPAEAERIGLGDEDGWVVMMVIGGEGVLTSDSGAEPLMLGRTLLVPASCRSRAVVKAGEGFRALLVHPV